MNKRPEPPITYQEAFEKYLGPVKDVMGKPLPMKCKSCDGQFLSLDPFFEHVKTVHKQRVVYEKQLEAYKKRRKEAEDRDAEKSRPFNPFAQHT